MTLYVVVMYYCKNQLYLIWCVVIKLYSDTLVLYGMVVYYRVGNRDPPAGVPAGIPAGSPAPDPFFFPNPRPDPFLKNSFFPDFFRGPAGKNGGFI